MHIQMHGYTMKQSQNKWDEVKWWCMTYIRYNQFRQLKQRWTVNLLIHSAMETHTPPTIFQCIGPFGPSVRFDDCGWYWTGHLLTTVLREMWRCQFFCTWLHSTPLLSSHSIRMQFTGRSNQQCRAVSYMYVRRVYDVMYCGVIWCA